MQFPCDDLFEIVIRSIDPPAKTAIVGHPPGEYYAGQILLFGERAAFFVKPSPDAHTAYLGIDAHLVTIEPVAGGIVPAAIAIAGDLVPVVRLECERLSQLHGRAIADHLVVEQGDETAFLEIVDLAADFSVGIGGHVLVDPANEFRDAGDVLDHRIAHLEPALAELLRALAFHTARLGRLLGH